MQGGRFKFGPIFAKFAFVQDKFSSLVSEYSERLYWHIRGIVGSHQDADDVLQDVFLKAWKALPDFKGESSEFTWLWRIATNESLSFLKKRRVRAAFGLEALELKFASGKSYDEGVDPLKAETALRKAIGSLPSKQRSVFMMRYYEELSYEQISEITGTSTGALKASYHIAYEKIKAFLLEDSDGNIV